MRADDFPFHFVCKLGEAGNGSASPGLVGKETDKVIFNPHVFQFVEQGFHCREDAAIVGAAS